ncbi:MAG: hypothetical protein IJO32_01375 [Bacilli bacterium]|nr:hypothetical protein [Bacilli bacterium]
MKENILKLFGGATLNNKVMVKMWDEERNKWYFEIIDVKKQEKNAIISYEELIKRKTNERDINDKITKC